MASSKMKVTVWKYQRTHTHILKKGEPEKYHFVSHPRESSSMFNQTSEIEKQWTFYIHLGSLFADISRHPLCYATVFLSSPSPPPPLSHTTIILYVMFHHCYLYMEFFVPIQSVRMWICACVGMLFTLGTGVFRVHHGYQAEWRTTETAIRNQIPLELYRMKHTNAPNITKYWKQLAKINTQIIQMKS